MAPRPSKRETKTVDAAPLQRGTRQRAAIRAVVTDSSHPLLPLEIQERAQQVVPGLGLATIYRNLKLLVEEGGVRLVELPGAAPRFESALHGHHHHFQCRTCERVFDVHQCPGNFAELAPRGFTIESHELTLYGRCADCSHTAPAQAGAVKLATPSKRRSSPK